MTVKICLAVLCALVMNRGAAAESLIVKGRAGQKAFIPQGGTEIATQDR